ncbi:MAG: TlpA disulfide reductase family protein [Candidatus Latescibacteria bacterium]|nr:TlpA disulfide reductase family protein [Candidatus Latescibacterota bacterium]
MRISIVFFFLCLISCGNSTPQAPEDDAPLATEITLSDVDGEIRTLSSYRGQVVVLNFFATWCAPCQAEMPMLEANIWREYRDRGVAVLGVDLQEDLGLVKLFAVNNGLSFPLVIDDTGDVFRDYASGSVPLTSSSIKTNASDTPKPDTKNIPCSPL